MSLKVSMTVHHFFSWVPLVCSLSPDEAYPLSSLKKEMISFGGNSYTAEAKLNRTVWVLEQSSNDQWRKLKAIFLNQGSRWFLFVFPLTILKLIVIFFPFSSMLGLFSSLWGLCSLVWDNSQRQFPLDLTWCSISVPVVKAPFPRRWVESFQNLFASQAPLSSCLEWSRIF